MSHAQLTIFSIPKSFSGHSEIVQRNAINSWVKLGAEIFLFGDDFGVEEVAIDVGARHFTKVAKTELGTPLLNGVFEEAQREAGNQHLCYVNSDIILFSDILEALEVVEQFDCFLLSGQRQSLWVLESLDFSVGWEGKLRGLVADQGKLYKYGSMNYFMFSRESGLQGMPPFAVGRSWWDNWMIFNARDHGYPVIDATKFVLVVHQNHDYAHVPSKYVKNHWEGPEGDENRLLCSDKVLGLVDADYFLEEHGSLRPQTNKDRVSDSYIRLGMAYRKANKIKAVRYYLQSFKANRSRAAMIAIMKLFIPG